MKRLRSEVLKGLSSETSLESEADQSVQADLYLHHLCSWSQFCNHTLRRNL